MNALTIFVAIVAVCFVGQLVALILLLKGIKESSGRLEKVADRMEQRAGPALDAVQAILSEVKPKISEITSNLAEAASTIRSQVANAAEATGEVVERVRMQATRLDDLVHSTANKVEQTTDFLQNSVITPVRRVHAIVQAVSAGIAFLRHNRARKQGPQLAAEEDEEMFI